MLDDFYAAQAEEMKEKYLKGATLRDLAAEYRRSEVYVRKKLGDVFVPGRDRKRSYLDERDAHKGRVWNVEKGWLTS